MAVLLRVFVGQHRLGTVWGAPDMVLEVMSPHPRIGDLQERIRWCNHYGVQECWLVH